MAAIPPLESVSPETARYFVESIDLAGGSQTESLVARDAVPLPRLRAPLALVLGAEPDRAIAEAPAPAAPRPATGSDAAGLNVQAGREQGVMVGSQLLSFSSDVTESRRAAAINSCLLAQLHAAKLYPAPDTPEAARAWHATYVNTLINLGWALQSGVTANQSTGSRDASVDQVLLEVLGVLLGGGTAIALATKVIGAIAKAKASDPFIVLYQSRVVEQNAVEFGAGLASGADAGFLLSVVECTMQLSSEQKQFLFFKWNADSALATGRRFDFGLSETIYAAAQPIIEQKVAPYVRNFVATLDI